MLNEKNAKYQITGCLCLGETGKISDLSKDTTIVNRITQLISSDQEDVRQAASIALGKLALGNISHFLPQVMNAIKDPKTKHRYLYLNSIREIILNDSHALESECNTLTDQLLNLSNHPEERIRTLVAECLGTLFSAYPIDMQTDI